MLWWRLHEVLLYNTFSTHRPGVRLTQKAMASMIWNHRWFYAWGGSSSRLGIPEFKERLQKGGNAWWACRKRLNAAKSWKLGMPRWCTAPWHCAKRGDRKWRLAKGNAVATLPVYLNYGAKVTLFSMAQWHYLATRIWREEKARFISSGLSVGRLSMTKFTVMPPPYSSTATGIYE